MTTVSIRIEDKDKKELDEMLSAMGMSISTFYMIYTKKALRERRIPFIIDVPQDPFFSEENVAQIQRADQQVRRGHVVKKSMAELEAMADE